MHSTGGPFTTVEVEDTKTFLRILHLLDSQLSTSNYSVLNQLVKHGSVHHIGYL